MSPPKNISELRSFLGLVNYYGKFVENLGSVCQPLHRLLRANVTFTWDEKCSNSFNKLKILLSEAPVLCHYNPSLPVGLACDASSKGLGAVLYHVLPDGSEKPISFASKTLNKAEQKYSQIEKEALGIIFGIKKFHQYIYGRNFLLVTDHKPLLTIFSPHKGISVTTANRLQRWALLLSGYNYSIIYKPSECHSNADSLSRLPLVESLSKFNVGEKTVRLIQNLQMNKLPISPEKIGEATLADSSLSTVLKYIQIGWPDKVDPDLRLFKYKAYELSCEQNCI
jgi:hypothetical protein